MVRTHFLSLRARGSSAGEHSKVPEWHLMQVAEQLAVAQARVAHKKSSSRAFDAALLNVLDAVEDQGSLSANVHRILDTSLQKSTTDFCILS